MKSKYIKPQSNKSSLFKNAKLITGVIFFLIIISSPWFVVLLRNASPRIFESVQLINFNDEALKDETNIYRGEMIKSGITGIIGRLIINKVSIYSMEITKRYLETFDPQFLFFTGDLNILKSTHASGAIYLSLLPLICVGIYYSLRCGKKFVSILLLISPIPGIFCSDPL